MNLVKVHYDTNSTKSSIQVQIKIKFSTRLLANEFEVPSSMVSTPQYLRMGKLAAEKPTQYVEEAIRLRIVD